MSAQGSAKLDVKTAAYVLLFGDTELKTTLGAITYTIVPPPRTAFPYNVLRAETEVPEDTFDLNRRNLTLVVDSYSTNVLDDEGMLISNRVIELLNDATSSTLVLDTWTFIESMLISSTESIDTLGSGGQVYRTTNRFRVRVCE